MKRFTEILVILLSILFVFPSCEEDSLLKEARKRRAESEIKTRAIVNSVTSIEGPKDLIVGQTYTYKLKFSQSIKEYTEFMVSGISQCLLIKYQALWIDAPILSVAPGKNEITFEAMAIGAKKNATINIYSQKGDNFNARIDGITIVNPQFSIEGPTDVIPEMGFTLSAYYKYGGSSGREIRFSYNSSKFTLLSRPNFIAASSRYEAKYKASSNTATNQRFTYEIVGTYKGRYNANYNYSIAEAEHTVNILNPFSFKTSVTADVICPGTEIICEIPDFKFTDVATVSWNSNDGFVLKSGQNTRRAIFVASDKYNGYSHISLTGTYKGKTYNETSKEYWIGKPKVRLNDIPEIFNRESRYSIGIFTEGPNNSVNWRLLSGDAILSSPSKKSVHVKSTAMESVADNINIAVDVANECGVVTQIIEVLVAKTIPVIPDKFNITNLEFDGRNLEYQVIYKATKQYSFSSLFTMILYKGTYDNSLYTDWQWQGQSNGSYLPPSVPLDCGYACYHYSSWDNPETSLSLQAGNTVVYTASINIHNSKKITDVEYLIVYYIDYLGNRLHYDLYDFVDFLEYI